MNSNQICPEFTEPYRQCKNCGDTLKRDVNHICTGKPAPLDLGSVDDLTGEDNKFGPASRE